MRKARAALPADRIARAGLLVWAPLCLGLGIGAWFALRIEPGMALYAGLALAGGGAWAAGGAARRAGMRVTDVRAILAAEPARPLQETAR